MKNLFCLLLSAVMVLGFVGCGAEGALQDSGKSDNNTPRDPDAARFLAEFAVKMAAYPDLPDMPNEKELEEAFSTIDYQTMGAEAYELAQEKIWEEWDARSEAYYSALKALRSEGTACPDAFLSFTREAAGAILSAEENTVLSPANLYLALAMLSETTAGASRAELLSLLGLTDTEEARQAGNYIWRNLYGKTASGETTLASALWLNEGISFAAETLDVLAEEYLASSYRAPMGEEKTDKAIAEWVNENTGSLLSDAAGNLKTDPETALMLLTTLYFSDEWSGGFSQEQTEKGIFTSFDGSGKTAAFMRKTESAAAYARGENYTVAQLSFKGGRAIRFLLPDEGTELSELLAGGEAVGGLLTYDMGVCQQMGKIVWRVPKFDVGSELELSDALRALGVEEVFEAEKADFSPLVDEAFDGALSVTQVRHAARVSIDEKGCEAAAFTAVAVDTNALEPEDLPTVEMELNRPFAFLITGVDGLPLFLGTVNAL